MIIDGNSTEVKQKEKEMANRKENMRKLEDWSRRSIIPIKGV